MKISVVVCTYNGEKYIAEQLNSILCQTQKPDEIVICDDASIDATVHICEEILVNKKICEYKIIKNEKNVGIVKNFENALKLSSGDVVFTCDQDDYWKPDKISIMMPFFERKNCLLVFSDAELVGTVREKISEYTLWDSISFMPEQIAEHEGCMKVLLKHCVVTGATMAVKRELLNAITYYPECWLHDGWLAINAAIRGEIIAVNQCLIEYRQHENNAIGTHVKNRYKGMFYDKKKWAERYKKFYQENKNILTHSDRNKVKECIEFWNEMNYLGQVNIIRFVMILVKNIVNRRIYLFASGNKAICKEIKERIVG